MHITKVEMKTGEVYEGYIWCFKPTEGWFTLTEVYEGDKFPNKIYFSDVKSCISKNQRRIENGEWIIEDRDELERAKSIIREYKEYGWECKTKND